MIMFAVVENTASAHDKGHNISVQNRPTYLHLMDVIRLCITLWVVCIMSDIKLIFKAKKSNSGDNPVCNVHNGQF